GGGPGPRLPGPRGPPARDRPPARPAGGGRGDERADRARRRTGAPRGPDRPGLARRGAHLLPRPVAQGTPPQAPDGGFTPRPPHRPITKFERRGLAAGHDVVDLVFRRTP